MMPFRTILRRAYLPVDRRKAPPPLGYLCLQMFSRAENDHLQLHRLEDSSVCSIQSASRSCATIDNQLGPTAVPASHGGGAIRPIHKRLATAYFSVLRTAGCRSEIRKHEPKMTTMQPNFRSPDALIAEAQNAWHRLFEHSTVPVLLLTPNLKIVDANESYLREVLRPRDALAGLDMFDAFPDNPHFAHANGVRNLAASFEKVLHEGRGHTMPLQRYDIRPDGRPWEVRFWHPKNWPIVDDKGSIVALVHHVTDATASILRWKADVTASVLVRPNTHFLDPLQRADAAIMDARETVRETQEAILRVRDQMEYPPYRRLLKNPRSF